MKHANDTRISIGTSGWTYDGWRGSLYPEALRKSDWLPFYASRFRTVEINGSFYRTPSLEAVQAWHDHTPKNFHFAWKASKFITHWKRLSDKCENSIALMDSRLRALEQKISVVLFQLPPNFLEDAERLASFLAMLPRCYRYAFEFRHRSWYVDRVLTILQEANVALCFSDHADAPAPWETTAGHIYVRGHGPSGRYHGTILLARCGVGLMQLCVGNLKSARFISISTMTKKLRRHQMGPKVSRASQHAR